jgi:hypothetical protein
MHGIYRHHVADSGKGTRSRLTNNGKATSQGHSEKGKELSYLRPELLMKSRYYGLENAKGVDNILTVPSANQLVCCIGRVYGA